MSKSLLQKNNVQYSYHPSDSGQHKSTQTLPLLFTSIHKEHKAAIGE